MVVFVYYSVGVLNESQNGNQSVALSAKQNIVLHLGAACAPSQNRKYNMFLITVIICCTKHVVQMFSRCANHKSVETLEKTIMCLPVYLETCISLIDFVLTCWAQDHAENATFKILNL